MPVIKILMLTQIHAASLFKCSAKMAGLMHASEGTQVITSWGPLPCMKPQCVCVQGSCVIYTFQFQICCYVQISCRVVLFHPSSPCSLWQSHPPLQQYTLSSDMLPNQLLPLSAGQVQLRSWPCLIKRCSFLSSVLEISTHSSERGG